MGAEDSMRVRKIYPLFPKEIRPGRPEERALIFFVDRVKTIWFEKYFPRFPRLPGRIGQTGITKESDLDVTIWN